MLEVLAGDCRDLLELAPDQWVQTVVTSPPYYGLRDYEAGSLFVPDQGSTSQRQGRSYQQSHPRAERPRGRLEGGTLTVDEQDRGQEATRAGWEGGDPDCQHTLIRRDHGAEIQANQQGSSRDGQIRRTCRHCGARRLTTQLGMEATPQEYVDNLVRIFRQIRRVLRDDGTVWLNLGDSYAGSSMDGGTGKGSLRTYHDGATPHSHSKTGADIRFSGPRGTGEAKPKDLIGIPWAVAFALRADGWYLRADIIWAKPNPMPESVRDRPTKAHEYVFLLSKQRAYFYDQDAIREPASGDARILTIYNRDGTDRGTPNAYEVDGQLGANKRSVWTVSTQPYSGAHFATFPPKLVEPCVLAGTSPMACGICGAPWTRRVEVSGGTIGKGSWHDHSSDLGRGHLGGSIAARGWETYRRETTGWAPTCDHQDPSGRCLVLDPFTGSGTVGVVCGQLDRSFIGFEQNLTYAQMAQQRIQRDGRPGDRDHQPPAIHADQLQLLP